MKKALFVILTAAILASYGYCAVLMQDDFESYAVNSWPSPWTKDANANQSSTNKIVADPQNPSNKVLQLHGSLGGCWGALAYYPCAFSDDFWVDVKVRNGSETLTGCHPYRASSAMRYGTYWYAGTNPAFGFWVFTDTSLTTDASNILKPDYVANQWYNLKVHHQRVGDQVKMMY